jgi:hypothetical protein
MGARLNRSANDLFAFYLTHLNNEEATILPAMWKHFTDYQLTAMRSNVEINMSMERYAEWMSWMFPSRNIYELTGMFMGLKKAPAPVRANMSHIGEKGSVASMGHALSRFSCCFSGHPRLKYALKESALFCLHQVQSRPVQSLFFEPSLPTS